ncbi:MAG: helix-turn-helix domain-containing protein [Anaerolineae bacterium]
MSKGSPPRDWFTLSQASRVLGVHPVTLRRWADAGELPVLRTPGGHRRFLLADLDSFLRKSGAEPLPEGGLVERMLDVTRQGIQSPAVEDQSWYLAYDEKARARQREMGRRLLGLLMTYLSGQEDGEAALEEARSVGRASGQEARARGLRSSDAAQAFLFFRDFLLEATFQAPAGPGLPQRSLRTYRRVNIFMNEVLLATLAAHEASRS